MIYDGADEVVIDFETRSDIDLNKCGVERYIESLNTSASCLCWGFNDEGILAWDTLREPDAHTAPFLTDDIYRLFQHVANGGRVVAHNARFELNLWRMQAQRYGWPELKPEQLHDTMAMARMLSLPAKLEKLAPAMRLPFEKDKEGHKLMLKLCKPRKPRKGEPRDRLLWNEDPADLDRQIAYCVQDVKVERAVWRALPPMPDDAREGWLLDQEISDLGIYVDLPAVRACLAVAQDEKDRLDAEIYALTDEQVGTANSVAALKRWFEAHGVPMPNFQKATIERVLALPTLNDRMRRVLEIRQEAARASTGKLAAMANGVCADGRLHGLIEWHVASTGRAAGRRVQPHNMPRTPDAWGVEDAEEFFSWIL